MIIDHKVDALSNTENTVNTTPRYIERLMKSTQKHVIDWNGLKIRLQQM